MRKTMKKIMTFLPLSEDNKAILEAAGSDCEFIHYGRIKPTLEQVKDANAIIGNIQPDLLSKIKNLELVQLISAGANNYTEEGIIPRQAKLANASGAYGLAISECMIGGILALMKHFPSYLESQKKQEWKDAGSVRSIYNANVLVLGLGNIGSEFAKKMHALGAHVTGIKKHIHSKPDYIEQLYPMEKLEDCLQIADIIACSLPGTKDTYHLFDDSLMQHVKPGALFVNVGRGSLIASNILENALKTGVFSGAYIDVTEEEPLPASSPLWKAPNLILTPHVTGGFHLEETRNRIVKIAATNIQHICKNEPIINQVNSKEGY